MFGLCLFHLLGDSFDCWTIISYKVTPFAWFAFGFSVMLLTGSCDKHAHGQNLHRHSERDHEVKSSPQSSDGIGLELTDMRLDIKEDSDLKQRVNSQYAEDDKVEADSLIASDAGAVQHVEQQSCARQLPKELTVELSVIFHSIVIGYFSFIETDVWAQAVITLVLSAHQYFEGFALYKVMEQGNSSRAHWNTAFKVFFSLGVALPALVRLLTVTEDDSTNAQADSSAICEHFELDMMNCFAAGTLLNFSLLHILQEVRQAKASQLTQRCGVFPIHLCFVFGTLVMGVIAIWA